jgi:hypothetical protein
MGREIACVIRMRKMTKCKFKKNQKISALEDLGTA